MNTLKHLERYGIGMKKGYKRYFKAAAALILAVVLETAAPFAYCGFSNEKVYASEKKEAYLSEKSIIIEKGQSIKLELVNAPDEVTYTSSEQRIAQVENDGTVKGLMQGRTVITAVCNGKTYKCSVTVYLKRLSSGFDTYTITQDDEIYITFKSKKAYEDITAVSLNEDVVLVQKGEWNDNVCTLKLNKVSTGTAVILVKRTKSVEPLYITVNVRDEKPELTPVEIYDKCSRSMVEITSKQQDNTKAIGSGFFIGSGIIATNYHVVEDAAELTIEDYDGNKYSVWGICTKDSKNDIALLFVKGSAAALGISSDAGYTVGDFVYTIGSPYGYTGTFSMGIISNAGRQVNDIKCIQITAPISKGNSGGPLLNSKGEVIGINTFTMLVGQNLNFSVKISLMSEYNTEDIKDIEEFYEDNHRKYEKENVNKAEK